MRAIKSTIKEYNSIDNSTDLITQERNEQLMSELRTMVSQIKPYAKQADESYRELIYNELNKVPAIQLYDGDYTTNLAEILAKSMSLKMDSDITTARLTNNMNELKAQATQIQTFLNEETSVLEKAKLWDSKFIKGVNEHIPPHDKKGVSYDYVMSEVMEAFRKWSSIAQASINMYGSQRLINATYEAVLDGKDPLAYMQEITDINDIVNGGFGGTYDRHVIVPNAGFFGSGFFF